MRHIRELPDLLDATRLEKDEQKVIRADLTLAGFDVYVIDQGSKDKGSRRTPGVPDLYAIHREQPLTVWVESKRAKGSRVSPAQLTFRDRCLAAGQPHVLGSAVYVRAWLCAVGLAEPYGGTIRMRREAHR